MERVIVADLSDHLLRTGYFGKSQHGFITGRSTVTNLLESLSDWTLAIDSKIQTTAIYVDFSRAFDTVSHPKLKMKLSDIGIQGKLLETISDFLTCRTQKTRVGKCLSESLPVISGVIQGSCLGPLLFLIYVNDLLNCFENGITVKLYADDVKLYTRVTCTADEVNLQNSINKLENWAAIWQLKVSTPKCGVLHIANRISTNTCTYSMDNSRLPSHKVMRDLGVEVDERVKFSAHINKIVRNASIRSALILKCFQSRDAATLVRAFKTYVRPILEYNSQIWNPHYVRDIRAIESVQRRFSKKLWGTRNLTYEQRLERLGLDRLDVRRIRADLMLTYKILFGHLRVDSSQFFIASDDKRTRGHNYKLRVPIAKTDARKHFFSCRVVKIWNELPKTVNFFSARSFRNCIEKLDFLSYCIRL